MRIGTLERCECDWEVVKESGRLPDSIVQQCAAQGAFDLVVASDVLYEDTDRVDAFLAVVRQLCSLSDHTALLLCQSHRPTRLEKHFFRCAHACRDACQCTRVTACGHAQTVYHDAAVARSWSCTGAQCKKGLMLA